MTSYIDYIADASRDCAIVAHRGAWHGAPENSILSIENAVAEGYDIVEIDVRKSADGHLFLLHDDTLARMAGMAIVAEELTLAELTAITLREDGGGEGRAMTDQRVPTLDEALEAIRGRIFADLDLKDRSLFPEVAARAKAMGVAGQVDLKTKVQSKDDIAWVRAQLAFDTVPFMAMARFAAETADATADLLAELSPFMCETRFDRLETLVERRNRFRSDNMALWVNTLDQASSGEWTDAAALADPDAIWGRLIDAGVSAIQTDQPAVLKAYLKARRA